MKELARTVIYTVCLSLLCLAVAAKPRQTEPGGNLSGSIVDAAEAAPINYAFILIHSKHGKQDQSLKPDERGRFSVQLSPGLYDVFVAAEGFAPSCKKIEITVGHTTTFDVRLKPDSEHLQAN